MESIKLYEISKYYIDYLSAYAPHLYLNKKSEQKNTRKYIGVVFHIHGYDYFAPLSSFKEKHKLMKDSIEFMKVKEYAVININCMFPVPISEVTYVDIQRIKDVRYKSLLLAEYRYIKSIQEKIRKNAETVYTIKLRDGNTTALAKRCNDYPLLEKKCTAFTR